MAVMQASEANINFVKTRLASPDGKLWGKAPGMVLLKPTSIAYSGTSATVGANGQVTFSAITSLSLNGVFSAGFDNYQIVYLASSTVADRGMVAKLRSAGTDASGSDYTYQALHGYNTTVYAARGTSQTFFFLGGLDSVLRSAATAFIYGPFLSQPTAMRNVSVDSVGNASLINHASTHSLSNSYDGFTLTVNSGSMTGKLAVYGVRS